MYERTAFPPFAPAVFAKVAFVVFVAVSVFAVVSPMFFAFAVLPMFPMSPIFAMFFIFAFAFGGLEIYPGLDGEFVCDIVKTGGSAHGDW